MSMWNKENFSEKTRKRDPIYCNINNLEMYFEEEKDKTRRSDIYLKCRKCLDRMRISCLHQEEEACLRFSFTFPKLGILLVLMFFISLGSTSTVGGAQTASRGRWCQKTLKEDRTNEVRETKLCSENYNSSCGFFSFNTCVFTRYKICTRIYNHTFLAYKSVMDCCPGWEKKDNDTCVELARKSKSLPSIHELSVGTFAAICSAGAFIMTIVFFIVKAVWKKKRKEKAAVESVHMEQLESLNTPQPQQVPLIPPPQPVMANPHALIPLKSPILDDPDLNAATAAAPVADNQEQIGMKLLRKIPETEKTGATAALADTEKTGATAALADTTAPDSTENIGPSNHPELKVELFIREEGDAPEPESQTQLQTQTLFENSKNNSQDLKLDPKI